MIRRLSCPQAGDLAGTLLPAPRLPDDGRDCFCGYSRFALLNIFRALRFVPGTKVLLPAYVCDVLLLPFAELGIEPVYYGITDDFQVDWATVKVVPATRAIITVNYFGFSLDYPAVEAFARQNGLLWINDNAHGFASTLKGCELETFGHVSVTSFRKVIPALNGAHIRINRDDLLPMKEELDRLNSAGCKEAPWRYLASGVLCRLGLRLRSLPDFSDIAGFRDSDMRRLRLAPGASRMYRSADRALIRERRRAVYAAVAELATGYGFLEFRPGQLCEGNSPMAFPVIVRDRTAWAKILRQSRTKQMDIHTWPSLPAEVAADNVLESRDRWYRTLCFPVHQDLDKGAYVEQLRRVLDAI